MFASRIPFLNLPSLLSLLNLNMKNEIMKIQIPAFINVLSKPYAKPLLFFSIFKGKSERYLLPVSYTHLDVYKRQDSYPKITRISSLSENSFSFLFPLMISEK